MLPPIESPPALTGVMPAYTRTEATCDGSMYDSGAFMWFGHDAIASTPSMVMRKRSSARPRITGSAETPPAP